MARESTEFRRLLLGDRSSAARILRRNRKKSRRYIDPFHPVEFWFVRGVKKKNRLNPMHRSAHFPTVTWIVSWVWMWRFQGAFLGGEPMRRLLSHGNPKIGPDSVASGGTFGCKSVFRQRRKSCMIDGVFSRVSNRIVDEEVQSPSCYFLLLFFVLEALTEYVCSRSWSCWHWFFWFFCSWYRP